MRVRLRNPDRDVEVAGGRPVRLVLVDRSHSLFADEDQAVLEPCGSCGQPTPGTFCAFCRARAQILGERLGRPVGDRELADSLSEEVLPAELYEPAGTVRS